MWCMHVIEAPEDITGGLGEDLDSLCSLLPVRWGDAEIALRQVAFSDDTAVGQVTVLKGALRPELADLLEQHGVARETAAECADLVVRKTFRNRGVGKILLESITTLGHEKGLRLVAVVDAQGTSAHRTFLAAGWQEIGIPSGGRLMIGPALPA